MLRAFEQKDAAQAEGFHPGRQPYGNISGQAPLTSGQIYNNSTVEQ